MLLARFCLLLVFFAVGLTAAQADVCSALRAQLGGSGQGARSAALTRQLNAIGALQRQRNCSVWGSGLFSACRDLASRRADAQRQLQSAARATGNAGVIPARLDDLGCGSSRRASRRSEDQTESRAGIFASSARLFCVRPSDGYFFPAPHSQFAARQDLKTTLDMCRFICEDASIDVYSLGDFGLETEEMASVDTRKKYLDLPTAFAYRENAEFKACDLQRYYRRVNEARARTVTPKDLSNANIPAPTPRPDFAPSGETTSGLTAYAEDAPTRPMPSRRVRQVGTSFFPPQ